jgi:hypothetical protein
MARRRVNQFLRIESKANSHRRAPQITEKNQNQLGFFCFDLCGLRCPAVAQLGSSDFGIA